MKMRLLALTVLMIFSQVVFAQKKKKEQPATQPPAQVEPAKEAEKPATEATSNPTTPQTSELTQHFARKYATAIQWNDYDVAKDALYDLIVENPGNDSLITDLAVYYFQNQKYASSVLVSQELLKRNPKNTTALEISASGYEGLGVLDRSLQNYESLYLLTNNITVLYKMAFMQHQLKRYAESLASVEILLVKKDIETIVASFNDAKNNPKDYPLKVAILNLKGMILRDQGDKVGAKKQFEQALAVAPDFVLAKQAIAEMK